jgi:hypothetical protein
MLKRTRVCLPPRSPGTPREIVLLQRAKRSLRFSGRGDCGAARRQVDLTDAMAREQKSRAELNSPTQRLWCWRTCERP